MLYVAVLNNSQSSEQNQQDMSNSVILHPVLRQNTHLGQKWQELSEYISQSLFPLPDPWMSGLDVAGTTVGEVLIY